MKETAKIADSCLKCGFCLNACPVYKELREEIVSPRGKLRQIKAFTAGELPSDKIIRKVLKNCLMCGSCFKNCPSSLATPHAIQKLREELFGKYGHDFIKRGMKYVLSNNKTRALSALWARIVYNNFRDSLPFDLPAGALTVKNMPLLAQPLKAVDFKNNGNKKVFYFAGCVDKYVFGDTGRCAARVLDKLGYDVMISEDEKCCGIPLIISGDIKAVKKNAEANIELLTRQYYDYIVFTCPTCLTAFKEKYYDIFKEDGVFKNKLAELEPKLIEITGLIAKEKKLPQLLGAAGVKVTYHDPCHMVNSLDTVKEPREIIKALPGVEYVEMNPELAASCCGSGGFYHVYFPETALKLGLKKVKNIKKTGAEIVLTACPACKLQIAGSLKRAGSDVKTMHIIELLDRYLK
ncbi:MAG: (Fe-S)-binding protein [Candidatus Firestonebacteria bacterium]|nr:(Fe-S)-binding protein [Candidatus Firestonebacteria bacterium]